LSDDVFLDVQPQTLLELVSSIFFICNHVRSKLTQTWEHVQIPLPHVG